MKSIMSAMKNIHDKIKNKLDIAEKNVRKLKNVAI